jgi:hypothetical protein
VELIAVAAVPDPEALAAALVQLSEHAGRLAELEARLDDLAAVDRGGEAPGYEPTPVPRLWNMDDPTREATTARLRAWVEQIYRPGYGYLAAALSACWDQHPLCLYTLDWLSELWSVLYLQPKRTAGTLAGQAEWQTRLLSAAADQMARETRRCAHAGHLRASRQQDLCAERKAPR